MNFKNIFQASTAVEELNDLISFQTYIIFAEDLTKLK